MTVKESFMAKNPSKTAYLCENSPEKPKIVHNCLEIAQNRAYGATLVNGCFRPKTPRNGVFTEINSFCQRVLSDTHNVSHLRIVLGGSKPPPHVRASRCRHSSARTASAPDRTSFLGRILGFTRCAGGGEASHSTSTRSRTSLILCSVLRTRSRRSPSSPSQEGAMRACA